MKKFFFIHRSVFLKCLCDILILLIALEVVITFPNFASTSLLHQIADSLPAITLKSHVFLTLSRNVRMLLSIKIFV